MVKRVLAAFKFLVVISVLGIGPFGAREASAAAVEMRINAGGADFTDINGDLFVADKAFVAGDFGYVGGKPATYTGEIVGTTDDALYQAVRLSNAAFSYAFDALAAGDYEITLYFTEPTANGAGLRPIDVTVEGVLVLDDFDIFTAAGGKLTATTETVLATVIDGQLNIEFSGPNRPIVSAIAVVDAVPPTPEPDINASPVSLDFGNVIAGSTADVVVNLSNSGTLDLDVTDLATTNPVFSVESPAVPFTLIPGANQDVTVRFSPAVTGLETGDLQVSSNDPDEGLLLVPLTGNGIDPPPNEPDIDLNPANLSFGQVLVGSDSDQTLSVANTGLVTLTVSTITSTNPVFSVVSPALPFVVNPGGSQDVEVRFSPLAEMIEAGDLQVTSDDPDEGVLTVPMTGEGVTAAPFAMRINAGGSDYTDINGNLFVADQAYTAGSFGYTGGSAVTYSGEVLGTTDDLLYQNVRISSASFSYTFDNIPTGDYQITLHFMEPTASAENKRPIDVTVEGVLTLDDYDIYGAAGAKLTAVTESIIVNVSDGQLNLDFAGGSRPIVSAIEVQNAPNEPDIGLSALSLDFGQVEVGTEADRLVMVSNSGLITLTVTDMTVSNSFFSIVNDPTPYDVAPGAAQALIVRFSPTSIGSQAGSLDITSNDPDEGLVSVGLAGEGAIIGSKTYVDVTTAVGITHNHSLASVCTPETDVPIGSGSAWADHDNDGDIDLYVTNHGGPNFLYENVGDTDTDGLPNFTDIAASLGVDDPTGVGHSAVFIDYDNDGDQDLYVTNWGGNTLYENQLTETGSVSFLDVTSIAGVADGGRGVTTAWADFDQDGYLDIYIAKHKYCFGDSRSEDRLFHSNGPDGNGDITFTDVTDWLCGSGNFSCNQTDAFGFSAGWFDYDNDDDLDLYVVNDRLDDRFDYNTLWRNDGSDGGGGWIFTDISVSAGVDLSVHAMGLGVGDYDNDGWLDVAFSDVGPSHLLRNQGSNIFENTSNPSNVNSITSGSLTWGTAFFDHDNDSWLDLLIVAGYLVEPAFLPDFFLGNQGDGTFSDLSVTSGLNNPGRARSASIVDFDLDGLVDIFVGYLGEPPALYHNQADALGNTNNWLSVTVEGTDSNRDGIGTRLILTAGGVTQMRDISSGPTHGGGDYRAAYFGMGAETSGNLVVHWPNGVVEDLGTVTAGSVLHLVEPAAP